MYETYFLGGVETCMRQARSDSTDGDASCARLVDPVRWIIVTNEVFEGSPRRRTFQYSTLGIRNNDILRFFY